MDQEIMFGSAVEQALALRDRRVGCLELLDAYLTRVERYNPAINAIVVLDVERARQRARAADEDLSKGRIRGPLHGLPMTVKEAIDVEGLPTTWGVPALARNIARANAASVNGLLAAGANIFGKTNVPYLIGDWQTFNAIHGTTNNPWDLARGPGGSSGGSAAALATALTGLEAGSDIGASIRNPAHYCGVYGHKPSFGIVPQHGHAIPGAEAPLDILVLGPLARGAEDLDLALAAMAGPEPADRAGWSLSLPAPSRRRLSEYRIALVLADPNCRVDHSVTERVAAVAEAARRAGAHVDDKPTLPVDTVHAHALYLQLLRGATGAVLPADAFTQSQEAAARLTAHDATYRAKVLRGIVQDHRSWYRAHEERMRMRRAWAAFFERYDVLLCPAAATAAFPHDQKTERPDRTILVDGRPENYNDQLFWAGLPSLVYLPATVAPAGLTPAGLPVGVQIVGSYLADRTTIEFARLLAAEIGGFIPPPGYT
jgi:amidase